MFIGFTVSVEVLMVLFSFDLQYLFKVAATEFIAGTAVMRHVLAHPVKDPTVFWIDANAAGTQVPDTLLFAQLSHIWGPEVVPKAEDKCS